MNKQNPNITRLSNMPTFKCVNAFLLIACLLFLNAQIGLAQPLIQNVPKDGTWAKFELQGQTLVPQGNGQIFDGHTIVRFVGTEYVDQECYRWIEFEHQSKFRLVQMEDYLDPIFSISKVLIRESDITRIDQKEKKILKLYRGGKKKVTDQYDVKLVDVNLESTKQSLQLMFAPFESKESLKPEKMETIFGDLECEVKLLSRKKDTPRGVEFKWSYTIFEHAKAPLGTLKVITETTEIKGDDERPISLSEWVLKESGSGAKSVISNQK